VAEQGEKVVGIARRRHAAAVPPLAFALLLALAGCGEKNTYVAPPPPKVTVAKPIQRTVTHYLRATGTTAAINSADLVARVSGFVQGIKYKDGDAVKKGKVLFVIEQEPYALKVEQSKASVESTRASLKRAKTDYQRQLELMKSGSTTQSKLDDATATRDSDQASYDKAVAELKQNQIDFSYTSVAAPFDGIVTARQVSLGAYVSSSPPATLASIVQSSPIYVNFTVNERDVLRIRAEIRKRGLTTADLKKVPVEAGLQNDQGYPFEGHLDYASPTVDTSTGTLTARGVFANANHVMLPGMFVRVRIPTETQENALLVPDAALGNDQSGRYLLVVNKDNVVEQRNVTVGDREGHLRVIDKGLKPDDRVIVAGLLRAVPGQKVEPHTAGK
jgi:RND family efflux transporter MFP subunit